MEQFINTITGQASHNTGYPAGAGMPHDEDFDKAAEHASNHAGDSGDQSFFSSVLSSIAPRKEQVVQGDIDEDEAVRSHKSFFSGSDDDKPAAPTSNSLGMAAAMQAMKMFTGGQAGNTGQSSSQSQFIGLAMGEASKLFDREAGAGRAEGASKDKAVREAGEMALKMYMKSQMGGGGASSGGGLNLMSLASKLM